MRQSLNVLFLPLAALLLASCGGGDKPGEPKDSLGIGVSVKTTDDADDAKDTLVLAPDPPDADDTTVVTTTTTTTGPGTTATPPAATTTTTTPSTPGKTTTTTTETRTPPIASTPTPTPTPTPPATRTPESTPPPARTPDPTPPPAATPPATAGANGATVFASLKCTTCHNVSSEGIAGGKVKDLAGVGNRHTKSWIVAYLEKKETLEGKPHKKTWSGTGAELEIISTWLAGLK